VNNLDAGGLEVDSALFIAVSIAVAAIIGYITNYLAIKMLFLPRREWKVWGWRVPFTPGLIPKRKGEIAASLGRVVSDYLVTADGLKEVLQQPELRGQVERKLRELVENWAERDETLEEIAARLLGPEQAAKMKLSLEQQAEKLLMDGVRSLWSDDEASGVGLAQAAGSEVGGQPGDNGGGESVAVRQSDGRSVGGDGEGDSVTIGQSDGRSESGEGEGEAVAVRRSDAVGGDGGGELVTIGQSDGRSESGQDEGESVAVRHSDEQANSVLGGESVPFEWGEQLDGAGADEVAGTDDAYVARDVVSRPILQRPLGELLDQLQIPADDLLTREAIPWILETLRSELATTDGLLIVHRIVVQMLSGLGGMMGMLAGMFVDENKITIKVREGLLNYLASPEASDMLGGLLVSQKQRLAQRSIAELLGMLRARLEPYEGSLLQEGGTLADADWFAAYVSRKMPWRNWINRMWEMTPKQLLASHKEQLLDMTPLVAERLLHLVSDRIDQAVRTLNLSKLVQKQVEDFPMDQVEEVILSITGREFKAITWLGALLGGLIGVVQALFYLWVGS